MAENMLAWYELSTTMLAALQPENYLIIWPIGSVEQHGPHLPLGTDTLILESLVQGVRKKLGGSFPALFLPMQAVGKSPEHLDFPGTISLQAETMLRICDDVISSIITHGFKRIVFLNGHGGNTALLQAFSYDLNHKYRAKIFNIDLWGSPFFDEIIAQEFPELEEPEVHAGSVETALMMYLFPHLVGTLPTLTSSRLINDPVPHSWSSQEINPSGVIGNPHQASFEKGKIVFMWAVEKISKLIRAISLSTTG